MKKKNLIIGVFEDEEKLFSSIDSIQSKGYRIKDVISPFPLPEIFEKLNLKTRINVAAFLYGLAGFLAVLAFLYWTNVIDYPLNIGGKPQFSLAFVVVLFVATILVTVFFTLFTFFIRDNKGPGKKPHFDYPGISDDKFLIIIDKSSSMKESDIDHIKSTLQENGVLEIEEK